MHQNEPGPLRPQSDGRDFTQKHTLTHKYTISFTDLIIHALQVHMHLRPLQPALTSPPSLATEVKSIADFILSGSWQLQAGRGTVAPAAEELGALQPQAQAH